MTETLTINDGSADVDFVLTKSTPDGRERINDETDLITPEKLVVRHSASKEASSGVVVDRHLVSLSRVIRDAETDQTATAVVNLTIAVPRTNLFGSAEITRAVTLVNNAVSSRIAAIMRGES